MEAKSLDKIFICFAAEDRYTVAEPIVYHLRNYGFSVWYDRTEMLLGDNRLKKNIIEGVGQAKYVIAVLSNNSAASGCLIEELDMVKKRYRKSNLTVFPIIYEMAPQNLPNNLQWMRELVFKEVTKNSGTRAICNHIACKITEDILSDYKYSSLKAIATNCEIPFFLGKLIESYLSVNKENINARVTLLYAIDLALQNIYLDDHLANSHTKLVSRIFIRLFDETRLSLEVDYREIWLLENAVCILINIYLASRTDSSI